MMIHRFSQVFTGFHRFFMFVKVFGGYSVVAMVHKSPMSFQGHVRVTHPSGSTIAPLSPHFLVPCVLRDFTLNAAGCERHAEFANPFHVIGDMFFSRLSMSHLTDKLLICLTFVSIRVLVFSPCKFRYKRRGCSYHKHGTV